MYLDYYKLHLKPFQISTDPRFLWLGEKHKEALAVLKYGILDNKGFLLLTGDVGTGKTTLLNSLIDSLGDDVLVALVTDPGLAKMDFFNFVADSFEMDKNFKSKGEFLIYLKNYLLDVHRQNKQTLLIIDECQHLNQKLLEEVRLLSNIEKYNTKLINIFFVGQSEFNEIILRPRNRAIRQRITINYNISALSETETEKYIRYRLRVAGSELPIFTSKAIKEVYKFSNGYPRLINIICDQALLTGYVKEKQKIDQKIVVECAAELKIPYGLTTKNSMATPEAADEKPVDSTPAEMVLVPENEKISRQFNRPLVIAFIVVLIIWFGLIATFFVQQRQTAATKKMTDVSEQSDLPTIQHSLQTGQEPGNKMSDEDGPAVGNSAAVDSDKGEIINAINSGQNADSADDMNSQELIATGTSTSKTDNYTAPAAPLSEADGADVADSEKRISLDEIKDAFGVYPQIQFGFNSNALDSESYDMLGLIARYCIQNPETRLILRGYTDRSGVRAYNIKLSEFRANMVKTFLVGRGLRGDVITTLAIGPDAEGPGSTLVPYDGARRKVVIEIIPANE